MDAGVEIIEVQDHREEGKGVTVIYQVEENGRGFSIACRTHATGREVTLAGEEGFLYIDPSDNQVYLQTVVVGLGCGISLDDELVEGLSSSMLQKVLAQHDGKTVEELAKGQPDRRD